MRAYKDNATLGVGKLDYIVASGIKQKDISDQLFLEDFLGLNDIKPMQTSYTQTAEDRGEQETKKPTDDAAKKDADGNESTENEPSGNEDTSDVKEVEDAPSDEKFWKNFKRG